MNSGTPHLRLSAGARWWWLMPIILATQEAKIRSIEVQTHPQANSLRPYLENTIYKERVGGVVQECKPQYQKKKDLQKAKYGGTHLIILALGDNERRIEYLTQKKKKNLKASRGLEVTLEN
jgi:hypothetical protein